MAIHREPMMKALEAVFVPALRRRGFVGSFPHFRRKLDQRIDFFNVRFNRNGGSFCLDVGQTGLDGLADPNWPQLPLAATTVRRLRQRSRVGRGFLAQQWFEFGPESHSPPKPAGPVSFHEGIAADAVRVREGRRTLVQQTAGGSGKAVNTEQDEAHGASSAATGVDNTGRAASRIDAGSSDPWPSGAVQP